MLFGCENRYSKVLLYMPTYECTKTRSTTMGIGDTKESIRIRSRKTWSDGARITLNAGVMCSFPLHKHSREWPASQHEVEPFQSG